MAASMGSCQVLRNDLPHPLFVEGFRDMVSGAELPALFHDHVLAQCAGPAFSVPYDPRTKRPAWRRPARVVSSGLG